MNRPQTPQAAWAEDLETLGYHLRYLPLPSAASLPPSLQRTVTQLEHDRFAGLLLAINTGATVQQRWWKQRQHQEETSDPFDRFCRAEIALVLEDTEHRFVFPLADKTPDLLTWLTVFELPVGSPVLQGIHPHYGSWWAVRALVALKTTHEIGVKTLPATTLRPREAGRLALDKSPCTSCPAPCVAACPGHAVQRKGWQAQACMTQRLLEDSPCAFDCPARVACPVGIEYHYPTEIRAYHYGVSLRIIREYCRANVDTT